MNTDTMHNRNCFDYLIQLKPFINPTIIQFLPYLSVLGQLNNEYDEKIPYGNMYTSVSALLEDQIDSIYPKLTSEQSSDWDKLINAVYHNDNHIIENTEWLVNRCIGDNKSTKSNISKKIVAELKPQNAPINKLNPQKAESIPNRLGALFSPTFKPQHDTNIPSLKHYSYKKESDAIEYRFSTQAQRHKDKVRISPLFKRWLAISAKQSSNESSVNHIYFNNLGWDRSILDVAGSKEKKLTQALHELERDPGLKLTVITLPSSQGLLEATHYKTTNDQLLYSNVFNELLQTALGEKHPSGCSDLWFSQNTQHKLFGSDDRNKVMRSLLKQSFEELGISPSVSAWLSTAQKQAVWFHFIKYQLTNYILIKLKPRGYNFTCKDAIDRGAVSSAYYNLMKSIELGTPLNKEEFERALDSAAANVKGRGMNFHRQIIWNALDVYINANYTNLISDNKKSWLIYWRDMNCPHSRVKELLHIRMAQYKHQIDNLPIEKNAVREAGLKVLVGINEQLSQQVSGQRLLLEIVSRTSELVTVPTPGALNIYRALADELRINHGVLYIIGGLMKALLGVLLLIPSIGYSETLIHQGLATAKSGFFASSKNQLSDEMLNFSSYTQN